MIQTCDIIGIFSINKDEKTCFYRNLKDKKGNFYEIEDISEEGAINSVVLTKVKIYLSSISVYTLQKRVNEYLIYKNGGNNGRKK